MDTSGVDHYFRRLLQQVERSLLLHHLEASALITAVYFYIHLLCEWSRLTDPLSQTLGTFHSLDQVYPYAHPIHAILCLLWARPLRILHTYSSTVRMQPHASDILPIQLVSGTYRKF